MTQPKHGKPKAKTSPVLLVLLVLALVIAGVFAYSAHRSADEIGKPADCLANSLRNNTNGPC